MEKTWSCLGAMSELYRIFISVTLEFNGSCSRAGSVIFSASLAKRSKRFIISKGMMERNFLRFYMNLYGQT